MEMKFIRILRPAFLFFGIMAIPAEASSGPMIPTLQPYQVVSPKGTWLLDVKPSDRHGGGPSSATLSNKNTGEIVWKQELPYTFWQCCVTDDGFVGGYGYSKGLEIGFPPGDVGGEFLVRILDPKGDVIHAETTRIEVSFQSYAPRVYASWLVLDSSSDRMVIVMPDDTLRIYWLLAGELESALPAIPRKEGEDWDDLAEIRFIPDSRLMLLRYSCGVSSSEEETFGSRFVIIDERGKEIWSLDRIKTLPRDDERRVPRFAILPPAEPVDEPIAAPPENDDPFAVPESDDVSDPFAAPDPFADVGPVPEFVGPPEPDRVADFSLFLGDIGERVTYRISRSGEERRPVWMVAETARRKDSLPEEPDEDALLVPDSPMVAVKKLAGFQLSMPGKEHLGELAAAALGADGIIHVIETATGLVRVFGSDGKFLHNCDPGDAHVIETGWYGAAVAVASSGEVFARIEEYAKGGKKADPMAGNYLRFDPDGKLKDEIFTGAEKSFGRLQTVPGKQVFLGYGYGDEVIPVPLEGDLGGVDAMTHRADGQWLDLIVDVACAEDGKIAVRDSSFRYDEKNRFVTPFPRLPNHLPGETVTIYTAAGKPVRTLDFTKFEALERIAFAGGHIVATGNFKPAVPRVYVFTDKGETVGAFDAEIPVGEHGLDLRVFVVGDGKEILVIDLLSAKVLRYEMPTAR